MYCILIKERMVRMPKPSQEIFRTPRWERTYFGFTEYKLKGELIERDPRDKWRILLKRSYRQAGKVKKEQHYMSTLSYWDIVDDAFLIERYSIENGSAELDWRVGPTEDWIYEKLWKRFPDDGKLYEGLIVDALAPVKKEVLEHYSQSEEYHWFIKCLDKCRQGPPRAKKSRRQHQDGQASDNQQQSHNYSSEEWRKFDEGFHQSSTTEFFDKCNKEERKLFNMILDKEYRALASKFHPDHGGDGEKMLKLNLLKEKLPRFC